MARFSAIAFAAVVTAAFLSVKGPLDVPLQLPWPAQEFVLVLQEFKPLQSFCPLQDWLANLRARALPSELDSFKQRTCLGIQFARESLLCVLPSGACIS